MKEIPLKKQAGLLFSEIWKPTEDWKLHTNADIVTFNAFDNPNGIDLFKMSFGGEPHSYYKGQVGITTKGAIMLRLYRTIKP